MKTRVVLLMTAIGLQLAVFGQGKESDADLPLSAKMALQEMDRTIQQVRQKTVEKLKTVMRNEMQSGNLARANRINQEIEKISGKTEAGDAAADSDITKGEWCLQNGTVVTFKPNGEVDWGVNSWYGSWKVEDKKVNIVLDKRHGFERVSVMKFYCELPAKKKVDGREVVAMVAQEGSEGFTLYRKK